MRLLEYRDGKIEPTKDLVRDIPDYAILSHTWGPDIDEVSYKDFVDGTEKGKAGYRKIKFCAEQAKRDNLEYFWVDTCCIDKTNSVELQGALNSMFQWYSKAARCYVYLTDIPDDWESALRVPHKWFTRGWTLQELLAPASVEFFTEDGRRLGDKRSLEPLIHTVTGIPVSVLQGTVALADVDVDERFAWAEKRQTTREEDGAYCLLGIFGIFMPIIYGEDKLSAVRRLKREIAISMNAPETPKGRSMNALPLQVYPC